MIIFTPNTVIKSADMNTNLDGLDARLDVLETAYVRAVLASTFTSTTTTSFQDTSLKVTLPAAGTWLIQCDLRFGNASAANDFGIVRLYNQTTAAAITDSDRIGTFPTAITQLTMPLTDVAVTTTVNNILRVDLKPANARSVQLISDTSGKSIMIARRLS